MRIAFWNIHRKPLFDSMAAMAETHDVDALLVCEAIHKDSEALDVLRRKVRPTFVAVPSPAGDRFRCYVRAASLGFTEVHSEDRLSVREFLLGGQRSLIASVHGLDIRNHDAPSRQSFAEHVASRLRFVLKEQCCKRVVIIGDFNMNPFDSGMGQARGFNALMTRSCVSRGSRKLQGEAYDLYYNPMWGLLGDRSGGPAGTYYYSGSQGFYGWNLLDQVLVHSSIVDSFVRVSIVSEFDGVSLARRSGRPDSGRFSDHFPIVLELKG